MLVDGRTLPAGETVEADVCIVGAGPGGLVLALELGRRGLDVAVVESGGVEAGPEQELAAAERDDASFQRLDGLPRRQLGGNAHAWKIDVGGDDLGVRHVPLDEVDFEARDWLPHSGWPFPRAALDPYYARAATWCGIETPRFDGEAWTQEHERPLPLDPALVRTAVFRVTPATPFTRVAAGELRRAPSVRAFLHLTVTGIELDDAGERVERLVARRLDREAVAFVARRYVLAAGGAENPRLLLAAGIGGRHDLVGRFFMEHPFVRGGVLEPADPGLVARAALYDLRRVGADAAMGHLVLAPDVRRTERLLGAAALLFPRSQWTSLDALEALRAVRSPSDASRPLREPLAHAARLVRSLPTLPPILLQRRRRPDLYLTHWARGGWSRHPDASERLGRFEVVFAVEQAPDPDNRIVLGSARDRFGIPLPRLTTRWRELEERSIRRTHELLADAVARAGVGRLAAAGSAAAFRPSGSTAHHHLGTTRMAADPRRGVVDPTCRVHGLANLYVAGSSLFPTGGYANPTLSIVALAARLADHLAA